MYLSLEAITIAYKVILVDITKKETILINSIYQLIHTTYAMINILYKFYFTNKNVSHKDYDLSQKMEKLLE